MAEQGNTGGSPVEQHKVWTFLLYSGPPVQITLPGNPPLDFQGKRTTWKIVASRTVADDARRLFDNLGIKVDLFTEEENEDMETERRMMRGDPDSFSSL